MPASHVTTMFKSGVPGAQHCGADVNDRVCMKSISGAEETAPSAEMKAGPLLRPR